MKTTRKVVQHGPCTLTVSLPKEWTKEYGVKRGDDISVQQLNNGLFITTGRPVERPPKAVDLRKRQAMLAKTVGALYRLGHAEITVKYASHEELEELYRIVSSGYIGFEIVDETDETITIRKVSEPDEHEFSHMFRRMFHFLRATAEETAEGQDERLARRDRNLDKLADFCRRVVGQQGQSTYRHDCALYHVIEQLEKIGDLYRDLNREPAVGEQERELLRHANRMLARFEDLFFSFSLQKAVAFRASGEGFLRHATDVEETTRHHQAVFLIEQVSRELQNLLGSVLMLNL